MESTLQALGGIVVNALPTLLLVLVLHFYLKSALFGPLDKVLHQRYEATEGAQKAANSSLANAAQKAAELEEKLRLARAEIYQEQEQLRKQWREEQSAAISAARQRAQDLVGNARRAIHSETEVAREALRAESETIASQVVSAVLRGGRA